MPTTPHSLLKDYRKKRDFTKTAEPSGETAEAGKSEGQPLRFVVQKHDATRLHYDFRLELDGVLKSWAVTKGPSTNPADKRLAVRVEDHPLDYGDFEGTIPEDQYGGGTVMLWDEGTWEPLGDPHKDLEDGDLKFRLDGKRMKGEWVLVHMKGRDNKTRNGTRENWLLIKHRDEYATETDGLTEKFTTSVETGRDLEGIAKGLKSRRKGAASEPKSKVWTGGKAVALPEFRSPQLATLVDDVPAGNGWLFEMKYDGYRALAAIAGPEVRVYTRNANDWTTQFQRIVAAALEAHHRLGAARRRDLRPQGRPHRFLHPEGRALDRRRPRLLRLRHSRAGRREPRAPADRSSARSGSRPSSSDPPRTPPSTIRNTFRDMARRCSRRCATRTRKASSPRRPTPPTATSAPAPGSRSSASRARNSSSAAGARPRTRRPSPRSCSAPGKTASWSTAAASAQATAQTFPHELQEELERRASKTTHFESVPRDISRRARWVEPDLVAEIAYSEVTPEGYLRHPSFIGLRGDKPAAEVKFEAPAAEAKSAPKRTSQQLLAPVELTEEMGIAAAQRLGVKLTSPDRDAYPGDGVTKARLVAYYDAVAERMLRHAAHRPLSLVRCPQGANKHCFFQKHDSGGFPDDFKKVAIEEKDGSTEDYMYIEDAAGLVAGVQMNSLEFHIWGSRTDDLEKPDRIIFDIDPDEGLDFSHVRQAAMDIRDKLAAWGLKTFPMVTGGKGIHVIAPLKPVTEWPEVKAFCKAVAQKLEDDEPDRFVANMSKAKRKGRMFVDYLRNERGSTAIAPFSTRSRKGAPCAVPIGWDEVETIEGANLFSLEAAAARAQAPDPWPDYFELDQSISAKMLKTLGVSATKSRRG